MEALKDIPITLVVFVILGSLILQHYDLIDFETMRWKSLKKKERGKGLLVFLSLLLFALLSFFIEIMVIKPYFRALQASISLNLPTHWQVHALDLEERTITNHAAWHGIGDAWDSGEWLFRNGDFILTRFEVDPTYGDPDPAAESYVVYDAAK